METITPNGDIGQSTQPIIASSITSQEWLDDITINLFCDMLKKQFPNVKGLQDVLFIQNPNFFVQVKENCLQIMNVNNSHWVLWSFNSTIINGVNEVFLYDSLGPSSLPSEHIDIIFQIINCNRKALKIIWKNTQIQIGGFECGLFALANATAIAEGNDSSNMSFKQSEMRKHLSKCFETKFITSFPSAGRQPGPNITLHEN